jgi:hypothetical protein
MYAMMPMISIAVMRGTSHHGLPVRADVQAAKV